MRRLIHPLHRCVETAHEVPMAEATAAADTEEVTIAVDTEVEDDPPNRTVEVAMAAAGLMAVIDLTAVIVIGLLRGVLLSIGIIRHLGQEMMRMHPGVGEGTSIPRHHQGEEVPGMKIVVRREGGFRRPLGLGNRLLREGSVRGRTMGGAIGEVPVRKLFFLFVSVVFLLGMST